MSDQLIKFGVGTGNSFGVTFIRKQLSVGEEVSGSFIINGSHRDLNFSVEDHSGNVVLEVERVIEWHSFSFTAVTPGEYDLCFDNSFSWYAGKKVRLEMSSEGWKKKNW